MNTDNTISAEMRSFSLEGKIALITGASSGIGRHLAGVLARAGASVVLAARRESVVAEEAVRLRAHGGEAMGVAMTVAAADTIDERKSVGAGKRLPVRLDHGGSCIIKNRTTTSHTNII